MRLQKKYLLTLAAAIGLALPAQGAVITGESEAYGLSADLNLNVPLVIGTANVAANLAPVAPAAGTAPPPYMNTNSLLSLDVQLGSFLSGPLLLDTASVLDVKTGVINSSASSNVDGGLGARMANAVNTINGLNLGAVVTPLLSGAVTITATTIQTMSTVSGDFGALVANGSLVVENLVIKVLGITVATINGEVAPNTGIDVSGILGGVSILLNAQTLNGDAVSSLSLTTNAIQVGFSNVTVPDVGTGLNGSIVIGHTAASLDAGASPAVPSAVPEPASALLMLGGVGCLFARRQWKRRKHADAAAA
ncbi:MAG: PEP-CTERM sorting domain-containing protein [Planctomycetaceae bacterium]|nr:PEP-CTERM sorting domain-containing protein [Planctomycetaceae bacterium]